MTGNYSNGIARAAWLRPHNLVLPALFGTAMVAVLTSGFVTSAPNRLLSGRPVGLFAAADIRLSAAMAVLGVMLLATSVAPPARALHRVSAIAAGLVLLLALTAAGQAATALAAGAPALARIS